MRKPRRDTLEAPTRETVLDRKWAELGAIPGRDQIDKFARELGFRDDQIQLREFREEKSGDHIVRLLTD